MLSLVAPAVTRIFFCADLAAVAEKLEQVFEKPAVCVLAPRAELERCSLDEVLGL